ncbi:AraC family transcriptional regulator [Mucilaginibacter sp. FT3.2]|uniref:AraC family transcriptional regulator n=1 Tax=Mucilaginibacter sp. FT3.2 TaxID=2723090 RepID=UPI003AFFDCE3
MKRIKDGFAGQRMFVLPPHIRRAVMANPISRNFYITAVGYYPKAWGHERERRYGSNDYIMIYCTDGGGEITVNSAKVNLKSNSYFIIPANTPHKYNSWVNEPWSIYWMHFNGELAAEIYSRCLLAGEPAVHEVSYNGNRIQTFEELCDILAHSYNKREMEIMNFDALHFVTSLVYYREIDPVAYNLDAISSSIAFMKLNINIKYGLSELAKQQNISVTHYSKMFRQKTGSSPVNYFNELKVQRSCQELYFTDKSIKTICAELGFEDQYYFSRLFSKVTGVSPSKYKQLQKCKPLVK